MFLKTRYPPPSNSLNGQTIFHYRTIRDWMPPVHFYLFFFPFANITPSHCWVQAHCEASLKTLASTPEKAEGDAVQLAVRLFTNRSKPLH